MKILIKLFLIIIFSLMVSQKFVFSSTKATKYSVCYSVNAIASSDDGRLLYYSCPYETQLNIFDTSTDEHIDSLYLSDLITGIYVFPKKSLIYVSHTSHISVIETGSNSLIAEIQINDSVNIDMDLSVGKVYINSGNRYLYTLDATSNVITDNIDLGLSYTSFEYSKTSNHLYLLDESNKSIVIKTIDNSSTKILSFPNIQWPGKSKNMELTPDGSYLFVCFSQEEPGIFSTVERLNFLRMDTQTYEIENWSTGFLYSGTKYTINNDLFYLTTEYMGLKVFDIETFYQIEEDDLSSTMREKNIALSGDSNHVFVSYSSGSIYKKSKLGSVSGTIYDGELGMAIEGAMVELTPGGYNAVSDFNGIYLMEEVPVGNYDISSITECFTLTSKTDEIIISNNDVTYFDMEIFNSCGSINGMITDNQSGKPLSGVKVLTVPQGYQTTSQSDGSFSFPNVEAGYYILKTVMNGYNIKTTSINVVVGQNVSLDIELEQLGNSGAVIYGKVTDVNSYDAYSYYGYGLYDTLDATIETSSGYTTVVDYNGNYSINVEPGIHTLIVDAKGCEPQNSSMISLDPGEKYQLDFQFYACGALPLWPSIITGYILDQYTGEPISNADISTNAQVSSVVKDNTYMLMVPEAFFDPIKINVSASGYAPMKMEVTIKGNETIDIALIPALTTPLLKIQANNQDGTINISDMSSLKITLSLFIGNSKKQLSDWWVAMSNANGEWYSLTFSNNTLQWVKGIVRCLEHELFEFSNIEIPIPPISMGSNSFYFAIDNNADNIPDVSWWDSVEVNVE